VLKDSELAAVWKACDDYDFGRIVRLMMLTGCRREEIGALRWDEVDLDKREILLPGERVKNGRAHRVPLSSEALAIIKQVPRRLHRDTVFGERVGKSGRGFTAWTTAKQALDKRAGVAAWRLHDLRRTLATKMAEDLEAGCFAPEGVDEVCAIMCDEIKKAENVA
jgi:integrase